MDSNAGFLRITFSEPMNTDSFQPSSFNVQLLLQMELAQVSPVWSDNNTVITVARPSTLPAGLPLDMTFENHSDRNDVVQTAQFHWTAQVSGTADDDPVIDGSRYTFHVFETEGATGSATVLCGGEFDNFLGIETNSNNGGGVTDISFSTPLPIPTETDWFAPTVGQPVARRQGDRGATRNATSCSRKPRHLWKRQVAAWLPPPGAFVRYFIINMRFMTTVSCDCSR